jgi:hypothetical protein
MDADAGRTDEIHNGNDERQTKFLQPTAGADLRRHLTANLTTPT